MYVPDQYNASQIIEDNAIVLPRFQRKKSWDDKDRFELCISLFKEYPMGTIVLKKETVNKKTIKWLLDGRQRRDTLVEMQNPENIYRWAKTYLGFKVNDDDVKIERAFEDKLYEYLYADESLVEDGETDDIVINGSVNIDDDKFEEEQCDCEEMTVSSSLENQDKNDLADLLYIIQSVHKATKKGSRFTKPFDFNVKNFRPRYMSKNEEGKDYVDSNKLTDWILDKNFNDVDGITVEEFTSCFDSAPQEVGRAIANRIDEIKRSIDCVKRIHDKLSEARISIILLDNSCSSSDSQKIFEIINTKGVTLTNAEIMSARPVWNEIVEEPREKIIMDVNELYEGLGTKQQEDVVKWDVAATLTSRLSNKSDYIFGDLRKIKFKDAATKVDRKINYGFKLLAGRYLGSISKNIIDDLATNVEIDWNSSDFENEIAMVCKTLDSNDPAINRLSSYHYPLNNLLGDTVAMCYLFLLIKKYNELTSKNKSSELKGNNRKSFIVFSRILLDRLFYEYSCSYWKGSSDSRLKDNLADPEKMFEPIDKKAWDDFIEKAYKENKINGNPINKKVLGALTYYFSVILDKSLDLDEDESPQIDHIIPDGAFIKESTEYAFKDSLINYALLTPILNNKKRADINSVEPAYLSAICELEDVDKKVMIKLNDPGAISLLKKERMPIVDIIKSKRNEFVKGEGYWRINV